MASVTKAKREAIARYDAKTYKKIMIALRVDEDAEIIKSFNKAKENGQTSREWLKENFKGK